eukprot:m.57591 g.57591  ORF g.57591 m.57591 type:complete len:366 (+) comp15614_c0_seq1:164-1261(+)
MANYGEKTSLLRGQPVSQQPMGGGPPPISGAAGLSFAQNSTPDQLMSVMDYVSTVKVKQKAFLIDIGRQGGGSCMPANYSVKDVNGTSLLYAVEHSHPCTRCCCGNTRKMRLDIIPAAAVHDPSGDMRFNTAELMHEVGKCCTYGGASPGTPVAFTIDRSMDGSCFPCCRMHGACLACCHDRFHIAKGPAPPRGQPDTRPIESSLKQAKCGGCCTPTWEIFDQNGTMTYKEKGTGGCCNSCCPGFCLCACTDNIFQFTDSATDQEVGHVTRVNPKDCAGWCRQMLTDADNYDVLFPACNKEQKAALLASMLATDLLFFDDGGDCGCECGEHGWITRIKMFILYCCGLPVNVYCEVNWKQLLQKNN